MSRTRHAAGVEAEDPVIQAGQPGLALADQLRLKAAVAVARRLDLDRPELGLDRLGRRAVAAIARAAGRRLPGRIAQVLGQLGAQRRLEHPPGELGHQPARPGDLLRRQTRQRVLQRVLAAAAPRAGRTTSLTGTLGIPRPRRDTPPLDLDFWLGHGWPSRPQRAASVTPTSHRTSDRSCCDFVDLLLYAGQSDESRPLGLYTPQNDETARSGSTTRPPPPTQPQLAEPADTHRVPQVNAIAAIPATTTTAPTTRPAGTRSCANTAAAAVAITTLVSRRAATGAASAISSAASAIA